MRALALILLVALTACQPAAIGTEPSTVSSTAPAPVQTVCNALDVSKFDVALRAYDAATDAIALLNQHGIIKTGSPTALAIANANDAVLAAFATAEHARLACNSTGYLAALEQARVALTDIRAALPK
jgi:uncharacterized protein (DUF1330 family)